jgi:hypothetical protein
MLKSTGFGFFSFWTSPLRPKGDGSIRARCAKPQRIRQKRLRLLLLARAHGKVGPRQFGYEKGLRLR